MKLQRLISRARREFAEFIATSRTAAAGDRRIIARSVGAAGPTAGGATTGTAGAMAGAAGAMAGAAGAGAQLLIASAGAGNIGDQAMFESFLEQVPGEIVLIARGAADFTVPAGDTDRVRVLVLPQLIYGKGPERAADLRRFAELLGGAAGLSIIGADIMDGRYSPRASVRRATLAEAAARASVPTRILGFSWNGQPHRRAVLALRRATAAGVLPLLRDPVSAARARADGLVGVRDCADIVFTSTDSDTGFADAIVPTDGRPLAVVNVSALVGRGVDQVPDYQLIVEHLLTRSFRVVLLPHVSRPSSDDIAACIAVFDAVGENRRDDGSADVVLVDQLLDPAAVRGLAGRAAVVITGRMHLAIMALWNAVPPITLTTQGKVEGLMQLFGTPQLCIEPRAGMAGQVIPVIDALIADPAVHDRLRQVLPGVIALAAENFRDPGSTLVPPSDPSTADPSTAAPATAAPSTAPAGPARPVADGAHTNQPAQSPTR